MLSFSAFLYLAAVFLSGRVLYSRTSTGGIVLFAASLFFLMESVHWFLPTFFEGTDTWRALNFQNMLALSVRGISTPTTIPELAIVGIGRLLIGVSIFYLLIFVLRNSKGIDTQIRQARSANLSLTFLWIVCVLGILVVRIFQIGDSTPIIFIADSLGSVCALALSFNFLMEIRRLPPFSATPPSSGL